MTRNKCGRQKLRSSFNPAVCLKSQLTFASGAASSLLGKTPDRMLRPKCPPAPSSGRRPLQLGRCRRTRRSLARRKKIIQL